MHESAIADPRCAHAQLLKTSNTALTLFNKLITTYSKSKFQSYAERVFNNLPSPPSVVSWTALISSHSNSISSFHHFISMLRHPTRPNQRTLASLFKTCASLTSLHFGLQLHALSLKLYLSRLPFTGSALVNFYSKCRLPQDAVNVFDDILVRDEVCYAVIVVGLAQNSQPERSLFLFADMKSRNVGSTEHSVSGALRAAAELAAFEQCRIIHAHSIVSGLRGNVVVATSLIDGYGKCGIVSDARCVFNEMLDEDIVNVFAWNAMMAGYAQQGDMDSVIELFHRMKRSGVRGDDYSFLAILTASCNAGLVLDAQKWLRCMELESGVEPGLEHYSCVVGALARAGELEEAKLLIKKMPFEPDDAVWRSLLSACAIHGETKMAMEMGKNLLDKNIQDDSTYVILANIFSNAKSWDDVASVRKLMKDRRVKKEIGRSWIEVCGEVHEFFARDRRHERMREIYGKLEELMKAIQKLGYKEVSNTSPEEGVLEEKRMALWYHSERMALAFGVLSGVPRGKVLRVVKNLRICVDCHEVFKYMSRVIEREIIVRDVSRYHTFLNGSCTCGDYW